ncbi:Hypothetical predicted protein [Paramuricea clavata]|uniref:Uncharacterized protein n=1 Tax=Paramuricea clavata TaxID=317549 RepID=A0A6S7JRH9_PARCT|nr:Hypothetical predicted protein [Paramuricea clavata]
MDYAKVERCISPKLLQEFDYYLQRNSFRNLHIKFPLDYYKMFVFLWIKLTGKLKDWLYADADLFVASIGNETGLTLRPDYFEKEFGLIILGTVDGTSHGIYTEDRLVLTYFQYTVHFIFLGIPKRRLKRENSADQLLEDYETYIQSREFKLYCKETFQDTFKTVQKSAPGNTATLGLSATASTLGHATAGFAFTLAVDAVITIRALSHARKLRNAGEISEVEFRGTVIRKVRQTGCQLVAGSTGSMIGQIVIPVPVLGAMIGGFLGGLIGTGVSKGLDKVEEVRELKNKPSKSFTRKQSNVTNAISKNDSQSTVASQSAKGLVDFAKKLVKTSDENISQISSKLTRKISAVRCRDQNSTNLS